MPQMSPLLWLYLYVYFLLIWLIFMIFFNFIKFYKLKKSKIFLIKTHKKFLW